MLSATVAPPAPAAASATLGRFMLRRPLGRGAQGTVWLAFDPRLEREVAIKQMRAGALDAHSLQQWIGEARAVSRLAHLNIVTLFEADVQGEQPYLVFELVTGPTLAQRLRDGGGMAPTEAVPLLLGVLDALAHAHASGVVHRDLKPSNILLDAEGRARVMDFGLAAVGATGAVGGVVNGVAGSPAYMAPEAARGDAPAPSMDVFGAGMLLFEMLAGRPAVEEPDPYRAIYRIAHEDLVLPADTPHPVDDALRALVQRAVARDATVRPADARAFHQALSAWLAPQSGDAAPGDAQNSTVEFLLRRMRHKSDFPALSDSVVRIQRLAQSETESIGSLSNEILKDVALTNKLLRLVNSTFYIRAGSGSISTISRAVALVGYAGIRNLALSLVLLERMSDKQQVAALREEFLRSLAAGALAHDLSPTSQGAEEAFIGAVFQNLGRMLTHFYFAEEAQQIQRRVHAAAAKAGLSQASHEQDEAAARAVLGIGFQELGVGVARHWGLPDTLLGAMRRLPADRPVPEGDVLRSASTAGNEIAEALMAGDGADGERRLRAVAQRYHRTLGLTPARLRESVERARQRMHELSETLHVVPRPGSATARLVGAPPDAGAAADSAGSLAPYQIDRAVVPSAAPAPAAPDLPPAPAPAGQAAELMAAGIQDISNTLVENFQLNQVLHMVLETVYRALGFQRVVFCLKDARTGVLTGRVALGEGAESVAPRFRIDLGAVDLFSAVCQRGADLLIADTAVANIQKRLPPWFVAGVNAPTFLLLPLAMNGAPLGLIYADRAHAGDIVVAERELALLRTLRNQAIMAFKHAARPG